MIMSNETERTLHELKLPGMASCWSSLEETHQLDKLTLREGMQIMLQYERDTRGNNRIQRLIKNAGFRLRASMEELETDTARGIQACSAADLATGNYITGGMTVIITGPAGTGKSQIAYAVARILKLPWTTLDMSSINDAEQLTGSSRIYSNAKPGIIMEAFSQAGESNLVFIINELDKASSKNGNGNPADVLLTLLDNLGFTDNYMECMVPTVGVYPIATANDKSQISAPLMSRFAVIDIPDYTDEEKKVIFQRFALRKVFERMGMKEEECVLTEDGLDAVIKLHENTSGIRDLEQAAEHLAANALYQIEVDKVKQVVFDAEAVFELLG